MMAPHVAPQNLVSKGGQRIAAIVPESMVEALRAAEDAEDAAEPDTAWDEPGESFPLEQIEAGFGRWTLPAATACRLARGVQGPART
jgi:hypothetical protein